MPRGGRIARIGALRRLGIAPRLLGAPPLDEEVGERAVAGRIDRAQRHRLAQVLLGVGPQAQSRLEQTEAAPDERLGVQRVVVGGDLAVSVRRLLVSDIEEDPKSSS